MRNYNYGDYEDQDYNDTSDDGSSGELVNDEIIEYVDDSINQQATSAAPQEPVSPEIHYDPAENVSAPKAPGQGKAEMVQDFMTLAQAAQTGDPNTIFSAIEDFSVNQLSRFRNLSLVGGLLVYWAYKGKLSAMERTVMGLIGSGILISYGRNYLSTKNFVGSENIQAAAKGIFEPENKMSGYYRR